MTWAQYYVLNDATERKLKTIDNGPALELNGRGQSVTFDGKRSIAAANYFYLQQSSDNGNSWSDAANPGLSTKYASYGPFSISKDATHIRFITKTLATLTKYYKNIKVTMLPYLEVDKTSLTFAETELGKNLQETFTLEHQNINTLSVTSSDNNIFTPSVTTISGSGPGKMGKPSVTVTLQATTVGTHTGSITVSNGTQTKTINLSATVTKKAQTIAWAANTDVIATNQIVENVASATSTLPVSYTSDNEEVLAIEDGKLIGLSAGTANITAIQAGDDTWAEATSITKAITITQKEIQTITWEQDFYRLKLEDADITMDATSNSGLPITYVSGNEDIVSVNGNILTIVGIGETTITAIQAGDDTWAEARLELSVRIREVSAGCDEYSLYNPGSFDMGAAGSKTFDLPSPGALLKYRLYIPGSATGELWVYGIEPDGTKHLAQHISSIYDLAKKFSGKHVTFDNIKIDERATKLYVDVDGTLGKTIDQIYLTQASYLKTNANEIDFGDVEVATSYSETLDILYSNLPDFVSLSLKQNLFTIDGENEFGNGCGDWGTKTINLNITASEQGEINDTLVIVSADRTLNIPIKANAIRKSQAIEWAQIFENVSAADTIDLNATSSSDLAVTYTSSDANIATINEANQLSFLSVGTVDVTAMQEGNDEFAPAQNMTKTIEVAKATPVIISLPIYNKIIYGDALSAAILTGGETSCEGTWAWEDDSQMLNAGLQECVLKFIPSNTSIYNEYSETVNVEVAKAAQAITWEQTLNISVGEKIKLTATSENSELTITYSAEDNTIASIDGDSLTALASGETNIIATLAGNENYRDTTATQRLLVGIKSQTIEWTQEFADVNVTSVFDLNATATSGLAIAYSISDEEIAVINESNQLSFLKNGTVDIIANQNGNEQFEAAQSITKTIVVSKVTPFVISLPTCENITYGETLVAAALTSGEASVEGTWAWEDDTQILNAGSQECAIIFTPKDTIAYNKIVTAVTVQVSKIQRNITWEQSFNLSVGDTVELTAACLNSDAEIVYSVENSAIASVTGDTLIILATGSTNITATLAADENHFEVSRMKDIQVAKSAQTIEWTQDFANANVDSIFTLNATSTSGLNVTYTVSDAEIAMISDDNQLTFFKTGTVDVIAMQEGNDDFASAQSITKTIVIAKAKQNITWEQDLNLNVGDVVELIASSKNDFSNITYYIEDETIATIEGTTLTTLAQGITNIKAIIAGNENYETDSIILTLKVIDVTTGFGDKSETIMIYPNPARDYVNVNTHFGDIINIYDIKGQIVISETGKEGFTYIDINNLMSGNYVLMITSESVSKSTILIKH